MIRQNAHALEVFDVDLLGICRVVEGEVVGDDRVTSLPVPDLDGVLRRMGNIPRRNGISAGVGLVALRDPDLEIEGLFAEGEVVAFHAADDTASQILDVDDVFHQRIVAVGEHEVGRGQGPLVFLAQLVDQFVERACQGIWV